MTARGRSFRMTDGLILIAGLGLGLSVVRLISQTDLPDEVWAEFLEAAGSRSVLAPILAASQLSVLFGTPFLAAWTAAGLIVQILPPRPPFRHWRRGPGLVACLLPTSVAVLAVGLILPITGFRRWNPFDPEQSLYQNCQMLIGLVGGCGVLWAWTTMKFCGICRPQPTWTDRLGRVTGVVWIADAIVSGIFMLLLM